MHKVDRFHFCSAGNESLTLVIYYRLMTVECESHYTTNTKDMEDATKVDSIWFSGFLKKCHMDKETI